MNDLLCWIHEVANEVVPKLVVFLPLRHKEYCSIQAPHFCLQKGIDSNGRLELKFVHQLKKKPLVLRILSGESFLNNFNFLVIREFKMLVRGILIHFHQLFAYHGQFGIRLQLADLKFRLRFAMAYNSAIGRSHTH